MKKHESIVWLPPRSIGERAFANEPCLLALVPTPEGSKYSSLSLDALPSVRTARLIFDARDVTLLKMKLPALSGAKLRQAIPNAVEDQLLQDVNKCAFALGPTDEEGRRLIAVVDSAWLEFVLGAFDRRNIRVSSCWAAQLIAPMREQELALICVGDGVAVRTAQTDGLGWTGGDTPEAREHALSSLLATVLAPPAGKASGPADESAQPGDDTEDDDFVDSDRASTELAPVASHGAGAGLAQESVSGMHADELAKIVEAMPGQDADTQALKESLRQRAQPVEPISDAGVGDIRVRRVRLYTEDDSWREPLVAVVKRLRIGARARSLPIPESSPVDLLSGAARATMARRVADFDWRLWRTPAWLAVAATAAFLLGLNLHWGKLAAEKDDLRAQLETRYRQTFPNDRVIVDPVLQMERNVAKMRAGAGQSGPEDFVPMLTQFAQALGPQAAGALTGLEYRDGRLRVTFEPNLVAARTVREQMTAACQRFGLALRFEQGNDPSAVVTRL